jgi:benzoyl-CoA reductase/2-hydroxyglutaryl-CoA dehydratase subunit BcrC/BadD/HgdB
MAFTYNDALSIDRDKVRFWLQDTAEGQGPKPSNANFTDAEIDALVTEEGTWQRATAAGFEILASAWQSETSFSVFNGSFTRSDAAKGYREMAKEWRDKYGEEGDVTDELATKELDFAGDTVTPLFQRKAFGHTVIDWDPS